MKYYLFICIFSLSIAATAFCADGGVTSGGGGAYVCRDGQGKILHSKIVDLWEAENVPYQWSFGVGKLKIGYDDVRPAEEQFETALLKLSSLDPGLADAIRLEWAELRKGINFLPEDVSISLPDDLKTGYFPTGCPAEGMMYYNGTSNQLDIRQDIYSTLKTKTDLAAAWLHESIYKIYRETKGIEKKSIRSRHLVACLLSNSNQCLTPSTKEKAAPIPKEGPIFRCNGIYSDFELYPMSEMKGFWEDQNLYEPANPSNWWFNLTRHPFRYRGKMGGRVQLSRHMGQNSSLDVYFMGLDGYGGDGSGVMGWSLNTLGLRDFSNISIQMVFDPKRRQIFSRENGYPGPENSRHYDSVDPNWSSHIPNATKTTDQYSTIYQWGIFGPESFTCVQVRE